MAWKNNIDSKFYVTYTPNSAQSIMCSCRRMIRKWIPCKHILHVLNFMKVTKIPDCCVLGRFTKQARLGLPARRKRDLLDWGCSELLERQKFSKLDKMFSQATHLARYNTAGFELIKSTLEGVVSRRKGYDKGKAYGQCSSVNDNADATGGIRFEVGDPIKVSTKGKPKQNKSAQEEMKSPMTKNAGPLGYKERRKHACHQEGHNKKNKKCIYHPSTFFHICLTYCLHC